MALFIRWLGISIIVGSFCVFVQTASKTADIKEAAQKQQTLILNNLVFLTGTSLVLLSLLDENNISSRK